MSWFENVTGHGLPRGPLCQGATRLTEAQPVNGAYAGEDGPRGRDSFGSTAISEGPALEPLLRRQLAIDFPDARLYSSQRHRTVETLTPNGLRPFERLRHVFSFAEFVLDQREHSLVLLE